MNDQPVILIDAMNLVMRSHFSHANLSSDGKPTGCTFGFIRTIHDLRQSVSKRLIIVWDNGIPIPGAERPRNWREDLLPSYKATRKRSEDWPLIVPQLKPLADIIGVLGYPNVGVMGLEADDVMGILSRDIKRPVLLFSTDKDFYQLCTTDNRVQMLLPKKMKGEFDTLDAHDIQSGYGIGVDRWAEYLALGGDKSDNIKPRKGMGPKTAIKIIRAGANLNTPWRAQTPDFRSRYADLEPIWDACQNSYHASRIPTSWLDARLGQTDRPVNLYFERFFSNSEKVYFEGFFSNSEKERRKAVFEKFCFERGMLSLSSLKHRLFDNSDQGEQNTSCPTTAPPRPRGLKRSLI